MTADRVITNGWEALRGDPLPWLLDPLQPNLQWRVLVDLVRRPATSPAVVRARGGADAAEPISTLIEDFDAEVGWQGDPPVWEPYSGPGWRFLAVVQLGADPTDPRLHAAAIRLMADRCANGGFGTGEGRAPSAWLTARILQALAHLGWCREPRFLEQLAWLDEGAPIGDEGGWREEARPDQECGVTAVAVADLMTVCGTASRPPLVSRAMTSLTRILSAGRKELLTVGHPCLDQTDVAEMLAVLAKAGAPLTPPLAHVLAWLQEQQIEGGRWLPTRRLPAALGAGVQGRGDGESRWVTLKCATAILHYGVEADLRRLYPQKPS